MALPKNIMPFPASGSERGTVVGIVRFTAGSSPTIVTTGANGRLAESISRSAAGKYTLTLRGVWNRVGAVANLQGDDFDYAKVVSVTTGENPQIRINTVIDDTGLAIGDPSDVVVDVMLTLSRGSRGSL